MNTAHHKTIMDLNAFHRIDINLYPLFIAVYEQQNISRAAQMLCITQSAASHALQRLRQHLKDDLFVRGGSKMLPTPFAEQIYPEIQKALIAIQNISLNKQQFNPLSVQSLKIAIHDEIEPMIFPQLVKHFQKLSPNIQFISSKLDRKTVVADLAAQQLDFVIDLEQNFGEKIQFEKLVEDHFMVCSQRSEMNAEIYQSSPHIGVSSRRTGVLLEDIYLSKKKLTRQIFLRCQHYSTALQILEQQPNAVLTLPADILKHLQVSASLNFFEVPVNLPKINLGLHWHKDLELNSRLSFLKDQIFKIFA